jgi:hypothetical protein
MISSFDSVEAVYVGKFHHVCASVTITTKLIYLVITKTHNSDYVILIMKMLIHTLHEGTSTWRPWKIRIVIFPCSIGYQNYTLVHTNNAISEEFRSAPSSLLLCKILTSIFTVEATLNQFFNSRFKCVCWIVVYKVEKSSNVLLLQQCLHLVRSQSPQQVFWVF